ncbi:hypothetical protein PMZ80_005972 [Knufia obscura]|uniref:FAD/NAD(P)-binding domain-containing protein n=2 Tax=Knufia TaxID=430999 RepID=A0AAN8EMZ8_9EURO|nr:hypothetical protein PMZ80_005972 [Knufia obscura]KAK5954642.1 hypothetical protein OHC33_004365 [Knufia fluminis]
MLSKILLTINLTRTIFSLLTQRLLDRLQNLIHFHTYTPHATPKDIIVIGASYAGYTCAEHLSQTLPPGWRVVLTEINEFFNHTWLFPRASVMSRKAIEQLTYIPYPIRPRYAPDGSYLFRRRKASRVDTELQHIHLEDGAVLAYEYLVLATGLPGRYPAGINSLQRDQGLEYFARLQTQIKEARSVIVIGGGPVGIEVALDVVSEYVGKEITLIHSRGHLAHGYGVRLHVACMRALSEGGVKVILNERVKSVDATCGHVKLSTGEDLAAEAVVSLSGRGSWDLLIMITDNMQIMCTGSAPASNPLPGLPSEIITPTGMISVNSYLQADDASTPNIFAVGDIADTGVKKMGRAAGLQGLVAARNIVRRITGRNMMLYKPGIIEQSIDMTVGLHKHLIHVEGGGRCMQFLRRTKDETLRAADMWRMLGAEPPCV